MGRDNKYFTHVKPRFEEIKNLVNSLSEDQIAKYLGVGKTSWYSYKKKYQEFNDLIFNSKCIFINNLKNKLYERANGFQYKEKEIIKETDGSEKIKIHEKTALPDVAAINLLLKNIDRKNWSNDPQMLEIKKEELKIKRENMW